MYILPSTDKETLIVVTQGRLITRAAVEKSLALKGAKNYFVVTHENDEPKEKFQLPN